MSKNSKTRRDIARKKNKQHRKVDTMNSGSYKNNEKQKIVFTGDIESALNTIATSIKNGSKSVFLTKTGYERAGHIAMMVSDKCAKLGVCFHPCDIPIGVRPINKDGIFYTWMPSQYHTGKECDDAPFRIIIENCYKYNGMDADGNFLLENLNYNES